MEKKEAVKVIDIKVTSVEKTPVHTVIDITKEPIRFNLVCSNCGAMPDRIGAKYCSSCGSGLTWDNIFVKSEEPETPEIKETSSIEVPEVIN
jgi:predicted amidophosphoribosyltransferase